jgi:DNA replication protein DnaC
MDTDITKLNSCPDCGKPFIERLILGIHIKGQSCNCDFRTREEREIQFKEMVKASNVPEKYRVGNLKDWINVPGTESMKRACERYTATLRDNYSKGVGILFAGPKGTGKTKLQCYIGMMYMYHIRVQVRYISLTAFLIQLDFLKKNRGNIETYIRKYINAKILIIDDVGESKVDEWDRKYVFSLVDGRNNRKCVTLINTMRDIETQCEYIGDHNVSRLIEMAGDNVIEVGSKVDMRIAANREKYK